MLKKSNLMVLILLSVFFKAGAQNLDSNTLLWKISGNGVKSSSYIAFSTAGICETTPTLMKKLTGILGDIKVYYTETALGNKKYDNLSQKFLMLKNDEPSIRKLLPAKEYLKLKSKMAERKLDEKVVNQLTPLMVYNLLLKQASPECNNPNYTQEIFRAYAEQYGYETKELFNIQEAFDVLYSYGTPYYINEIEDLLNNQPGITQDIISKANLYKQEDLNGLKNLFAKSHFLNSKFGNEIVAKKRTKDLARKLTEVIKDGGVLFTLDLTNIMDSKNNIFDELRNQGYTISPVTN